MAVDAVAAHETFRGDRPGKMVGLLSDAGPRQSLRTRSGTRRWRCALASSSTLIESPSWDGLAQSSVRRMDNRVSVSASACRYPMM
jgi:hypothetical protein